MATMQNMSIILVICSSHIIRLLIFVIISEVSSHFDHFDFGQNERFIGSLSIIRILLQCTCFC